MHEFSSISVSSYEAGALADRLTEQSQNGWSVVAIVPTGSTVTAYLSREHAAGTNVAAGAMSAAAPAVTSATPAVTEPVAAGAADTAPGPSAHITPEPASAETSHEPAGQAAGWAASTAADMTAGAGATETALAAAMSDTEATDTVPAAAGAVGAAPAGWYADPSSRFELRYWNGSQWTEHVSRAGQQYTDPPVA